MVYSPLLSILCIFAALQAVVYPLSIDHNQQFSQSGLATRALGATFSASAYSVSCPLPLTSLQVATDPFISLTVQGEVSSNEYFNLPCKGNYFYLTYQTDGKDDLQIWFSGGPRGSGFPHVKIAGPVGSSYPAWIWLYSGVGSDQVHGNYPFNAQTKMSVSPTNTYFVAYNSNGLTGGVNDYIDAEYPNNNKMSNIFSQENVYIRLIGRNPGIAIKNIQIKCMTGDTCSKPQIPNSVNAPSTENKNSNLICSDKVDTIASTKKYPDITYSAGVATYVGRIFENRNSGNQLVIPTGNGIFNASFTINNKPEFQMYLYNQEFFGTTFEFSHINLGSGAWKVGNFYETQKTDTGFIAGKSKMFFSLDPSGISVGYDDKVVGTVGYDKFSMNDLLSKPNLYLFFVSMTSGTTFSQINVDSISRTCKNPPPGAVTQTVTVTQPTTVIQTQPTTVVQTQPTTVIQTQPTTVVQTQPTTVIQTQPTTVIQTHPTTVVQTQPTTVIQTQTATSVATSFITNPTTIIQTQPVTVVQTQPTTVQITQPTTLTQITSVIQTITQSCSDDKTVKIPDTKCDSSKANKDYGSQKPIPVPCSGGDFDFAATMSGDSDVFIALVDTNGIESKDGFIEVQLGLNSGKNNIKKILKGQSKRSEISTRADSFSIKISYKNKTFTIFINDKQVNTYDAANFNFSSMIITPFSGSTSVTGAQFVCGK